MYYNSGMSKLKKVITLFITTFSISITANSGYAILGVMRNLAVNKNHWFTEEEMNDYIGLAQSAPGPMAVNGSMVVGYQLAGIPGAFAAVLGVIIPPIIIMMIVTYFYQVIVTNQYVRIFMSGMQAGVAAMLLDIIIGLFTNVTKNRKAYPYLVMAVAFIFIRFTDFSMFYLIIGCIIAALVKTFIIERKVKA